MRRPNIITRVKRLVQFVAIAAAVPYVMHAQERRALAALVDASAQRLQLARDVALAKWDSGAPVEDVTRERQVIDAATTAGVKAGVPAGLITRFFAAQMEANKLIQYSLLTTWQQQGKAPKHTHINLGQSIRPQIDRIQRVLISALVNRTSAPSSASCRAEVADAIESHKIAHPEISQCLFSTALERALAPLCDSTN